MRRTAAEPCVLTLDGREGLVLESVSVDDKPLAKGAYRREQEGLIIDALPAEFTLELVTVIDPVGNSHLEGLYYSEGRFCTQCEPEGFRNITFAIDRPDILSRFVVRMDADRAQYPTLLSNGDLVESGESEGGRHYAVWRDPYPKPYYLFALVAGAFETITDTHRTSSGRQVGLFIHTDQGHAPRAAFAMDALKRSMAWDERVFAREYDLSEFHIVAVRDFNFGAMENKGLNIFNSARLLADTETQTDDDFEDVERVVAHEYFHNWTGNRITLRDWFQLCLKEGLTIYRDQEFSADQRSRAVRKIKETQVLWEKQFPEDAGPLAHPVRPGQYAEILNFYTATVYRKGAEVIRVLRALIGNEAFDRGMQAYFTRWDGHAITLEDFIACFPEVNRHRDFFTWYTQAGTPHLTMRGAYDSAKRSYRLEISQTTPPTSEQADKVPLPIPLKTGFIAHDGGELNVRLQGEAAPRREFNLVLNSGSAVFVFEDVPAAPIPAILRDYSAPVLLDDGLSHAELLVQMAHDPDTFTRWNAGQRLFTDAILAEAKDRPNAGPAINQVTAALRHELDRPEADRAFVALALRVPSLSRLIHSCETPDVEVLFQARQSVRSAIAGALEQRLAGIADEVEGGPVLVDAVQVGRRALRNAALDLLATLGTAHGERVTAAYRQARTMTERIGALQALSLIWGDGFDEALADFLDRWKRQPLAVDKWFAVQASAPREDAVDRVKALARHYLFSLRNPNRARALYEAFAQNLRAFHASDGSGYKLVADAIRKVDPINPAVAARLATNFESWRCLDEGRKERSREVLEDLMYARLSNNVADLVKRMLG
jgi:aminopeptidase N